MGSKKTEPISCCVVHGLIAPHLVGLKTRTLQSPGLMCFFFHLVYLGYLPPALSRHCLGSSKHCSPPWGLKAPRHQMDVKSRWVKDGLIGSHTFCFRTPFLSCQPEDLCLGMV